MASFLSYEELYKYLHQIPPLVTGITKEQIQPNGIELTLMKIEKFKDAGIIGMKNNERKLATTEEILFNDEIYLKQGCYKIIFNEIIHLPLNIIAFAKPRSSLLRCGVSIETAIWDSGYIGRSESLLIVFNPFGFYLKKNARLIQLVFFKLKEKVNKGYDGIYYKENMEDKNVNKRKYQKRAL